MPGRRRYTWRHPFHHQYILASNPRVRIDVDRSRKPIANRFQLTIDRVVEGEYRTFRLAENAIPATALEARP